MPGEETSRERRSDQEAERDEWAGGHHPERDRHAAHEIEDRVPQTDRLAEDHRKVTVEGDEHEFLLKRQQSDHDYPEDAREHGEALFSRGEEVALQEIHHLRFSPRVNGEKENREGTCGRVRDPDSRLHDLTPAPLEGREHEDSAQGEG